jgi:hypothetical protein
MARATAPVSTAGPLGFQGGLLHDSLVAPTHSNTEISVNQPTN